MRLFEWTLQFDVGTFEADLFTTDAPPIDGAPADLVDEYALSPAYDAPGVHTITIRVTGGSHAETRDGTILVDGLR
jgi:hypothetical protein